MKERTVNITLVEDDPIQQTVIQRWLEQSGHRCRVFGDGQSLTESFQQDPTDLLLLDWELPDRNGLELLQWLRLNFGNRIPVLFLTMRDSEQDVVSALRGGADDYLIKPARQQELLARIEANLRRSRAVQETLLPTTEIGPFIIDSQAQELRLNDTPLSLTQKEFKLACYLLTNLGQVVSRAELLQRIWGQPDTQYSRTVDTHISRLRKKLALVPEQGWRLSSIYQSGYRLDWLGS